MGGYEPVDLAGVANAGLDAIDTQRVPPVGELLFHGLPFRIGGAKGGAPFVLLSAGADPVTVPVGRVADRVILAHRRLRGDAVDPAPGTLVAEYTMCAADGSSVHAPIRERLEIARVADAGWDSSGPYHATGNNRIVLPDRYEGRWEDIGRRQSEAVYDPGLPDYFLWVWENPTPDVPLASIELAALVDGILVAAITTSGAGEHPFAREAARTVRFTRAGEGDSFTEPTVEVDRGVASYAYRLPAGGADSFLDDPFRGWGDDVPAETPHAYARIAAVPSATVTVKDGDREVGAFRWRDLGYDGQIEAGGARVEVVEQGRNWVHVTVLDDETGRPVPCRVHFRSPAGIPYQPHGHHDHVNGGLGTWHIDVGGDLRMGQATYAYIDGTCQGWLPRGDVLVDVARGFEYEPLREAVRIEPGQRTLELRLRRWATLNDDGWFSGDSHVHFLSAQGSLLEQQGEDLNVVNLLQSQWGSLFTNTEDFTGAQLASDDGRFVTWVSQENRQPFFGHMLLWGLREPVMPWCTDGPPEADLASWQETTMSDWADRCHDQGGTVVIPHFPLPNGEPATLIATGRADAVEMIVQWPAFHDEYYGYLNAGYRLPLVGGTDKMSSEVPVGLYRTYANIGDDEFTYERWCRAVREGRTFVTGGPILRFAVDGHGAGDVVRIPGGGTVAVEAVAEGIFPIGSLELVRNGEVIAASEDPSGDRRLTLSEEVRIDDDSWLAVRSGGAPYFEGPIHRGPWDRRVFAHSSPVYIACGDGDWTRADPKKTREMLTQVEAGIQRLRAGRRYPEDRITHHHGEADHQAFLERPFREAVERIRARSDAPS